MPTPSPMSVLVPSDINDLSALTINENEFPIRKNGEWVGARAWLPFNVVYPTPYETPYTIIQRYATVGVYDIPLDIPVGHKLISVGAFWIANPGLGAVTTQVSLTLVRNGITYFLGAVSAAQAGNTSTIFSMSAAYPFYPGDMLRATVSQGAPVHIGTSIHWKLMSDTAPVKGILVPINLGYTTLYTCPAGKVAYVFNGGISFPQSSGSTNRYKAHIVPEGQQPDDTNLISQRDVASDNGSITMNVYERKLEAGDMLIVHTNKESVQQLATTIISELNV